MPNTGRQETFNSQNRTYYKKDDCILLVYDITSFLKSFNACKDYYIKEIKNECKEGVKVIILGNKIDLKEKREVTQETESNLALKKGFIFMETSCEDNYNVSYAFETLIEMTNKDMIQNGQNGKINSEKAELEGTISKKKKKRGFC